MRWSMVFVGSARGMLILVSISVVPHKFHYKMGGDSSTICIIWIFHDRFSTQRNYNLQIYKVSTFSDGRGCATFLEVRLFSFNIDFRKIEKEIGCLGRDLFR